MTAIPDKRTNIDKHAVMMTTLLSEMKINTSKQLEIYFQRFYYIESKIF